MSFFNAQGGGIAPPMRMSGGGGAGRSAIDPKQMQEMQKRMEADIKSRNNPIELK